MITADEVIIILRVDFRVIHIREIHAEIEVHLQASAVSVISSQGSLEFLAIISGVEIAEGDDEPWCDAKDKFGNTALIKSVENGRKDVIMLLENGANHSIHNNNFENALSIAKKNG